MSKRLSPFIVGLAAVLALAAPAQARGVADLGWLAGVWEAQNGKDQVQNVYGPVRNNEIVWTFTAATGDKTHTYEIRRIFEKDGKVFEQEIAYGPALSPREPIPDRHLALPDAARLITDKTVMTRTGEDTFTLVVKLDNPKREVTIHYVRTLKFVAP